MADHRGPFGAGKSAPGCGGGSRGKHYQGRPGPGANKPRARAFHLLQAAQHTGPAVEGAQCLLVA